jgi:hypothetical protein
MARKKKQSISRDRPDPASCNYCGASVGEISDRTDERVEAVYDCLKCKVNYCDQCSYEKEVDGQLVQRYLRCESIIEKVTGSLPCLRPGLSLSTVSHYALSTVVFMS